MVKDPDAPASAAGRIEDAFTESVDVMPTILDWFGAPPTIKVSPHPTRGLGL